MTTPSPTRLPARLAAILLIALGMGSLQAQVQQYSFSRQFAHFNGAPYWTDDVADASSNAGIVDRLNANVFGFTYLRFTRSNISMPSGAYIAQFRIKKIDSISGAEPLYLEARDNGTLIGRVSVPVADQTVGRWQSFALPFVVTGDTTNLLLRLENIDQVWKHGYLFDDVQVFEAKGEGLSSCTEAFRSFGAPFWTGNQPEASSPFGQILELSYIWFLDLRETFVLPAGQWEVRARFRKTGSTSGRHRFELRASGANLPTTRLIVPSSSQEVGKFIMTPPLRFTLSGTERINVYLENIDTSDQKRGYEFDYFEVSRANIKAVTRPQIGSLYQTRFDAPDAAGSGYLSAYAFSAMPGHFLPDGRPIMLATDALWSASITMTTFPSPFSALTGALDNSGSTPVPPSILIPYNPALVGMTLHQAFITFDATARSGVGLVSATHSFTIEP